MKKEKTLELLLWGVVAYAVALLIYFTFKAFGHGADFISALGSILSGVATFYAAFVAIRLYNDWRDPHFLSKITLEQKEIVNITRRMKRHADAFLCFMKTENPSPSTGLNNSDTFSIKYQKLVNDLLDDIDDLAGLLKAYEFNFTKDIQHEKNHLDVLKVSKQSLSSLYEILADPNPIIGYEDSYKQNKIKGDLGDFNPLFKEILTTLPDNLSKYLAALIK